LIDDMSDIPAFIQTLTNKAQNRAIWLGFYFPMGLCRAWYEKPGSKTSLPCWNGLKVRTDIAFLTFTTTARTSTAFGNILHQIRFK